MFGKLKNKLKEWTKKVSKVDEVEEEIKEEIIEESLPEKKEIKKEKKSKKKETKKTKEKNMPQKSTIGGTPSGEKPKEKPTPEKEIEEVSKEEEVKEIEKPKEKKSFLKKLTSKKKTITEDKFMDHADDLEMILLENNVALEVSEKIIEELKEKIVGIELNKKEIEDMIANSLKEIIEEVLIEPFDILKEIEEKDEPYVMLFCGINGTGKTTHIAKVANFLKENKLTSVLAAGDTFRAAAVEQIKEHGKRLDVKVIDHEYGSDPASVGFDAIKYAKKNKIDVVLIDTAGRIHTAKNLLQEMEKIKRVCKPDRTIFVGESITGNDSVDQVKAFHETIGIDGIILSKADIDEKGGTALSLGYTTKKPIIFLGMGQEYKDLEKFDKKKFIEKLEL